MRKYIVVMFVLSILSGCLGGGHAGNQNSPIIQEPPKVNVNVPAPQVVDQEAIKDGIERTRQEIQTSSNATQANLSGLVNASVSKLGEKVTGVEASLKDLVNVSMTMNNKVAENMSATANLSAKLAENVTATANVSAKVADDISATANLSSRVDAVANLVADLKVEVGKMSNAAQVGLSNKLEQITQDIQNTAGRDVNYLPREAVYMIVACLGLMCGLVSGIAAMIARNSRNNIKYWQEVAMKAIGEIEPTRAKHFTSNLPPMP